MPGRKWLNKSAGKIVGLFLGMALLLIILTGCDIADVLGYDIQVEITGLDEEEIGDLRVIANGNVLDEFDYENGTARGTLANLRRENKIEPEHGDREFYQEFVRVDSSRAGETIRFNAIKSHNVTADLQSHVDEAGPGDTLIVFHGVHEEITITTLGLTIEAFFDHNEEYTAISGVSIKADDVSLKGFTIPAGSQIKVADSSGITLEKNIIAGDNSMTGVEIQRSSAVIRDNVIEARLTGLSAVSSSDLKLDNNMIRENKSQGLVLEGSQAEITDNEIGYNEYGISFDDSDVFLGNNVIHYNGAGNDGAGIYAHSSSLKLDGNEINRNSTGIRAENSRKFELLNGDILRSYAAGARIEGGPVSISDSIFKSNGQAALELLSNSEVEIEDSEFENNEYGILLNSVDNFKISKNTFYYNNEYGINMTASSGEFSGNEVEFNYNGLLQQEGGNLVIKYNDFEDQSAAGLIIDNSAAEIEFNNIRYNGSKGAEFIGETAVAESFISRNNIQENALGVIAHGGEEDLLDNIKLDAASNWWGTDNGDRDEDEIRLEIEEMIEGPVEFEPFEKNEIDEAGQS